MQTVVSADWRVVVMYSANVQMMAIDRPVINDLKREIQKKNISDHYHN
jgi:hypothetical protein